MNQCEKCLCFGPCMKSDAEVIGCPVNEVLTCIAYPEGIPDELLTDQKHCQFYIDD